MSLTIAIEGKGVIANCDSLSDSAGGTWSEAGLGSISVSTDSFKYGVNSIGGQYASKTGLQQYDLGAGNELDFTPITGTEEGQAMYIWIMVSAMGTLDTLSTYPLCIRFSSDAPGTSNYIDYLIGSNNDTNGWDGSWRCFVIDPTLTPSRVSGTQSSIIASVRTVGLWIDASSSARSDAFFIDQVSVGKGIRVTGTSTTGWGDVVAYCTDYSNPTTPRAWGQFQEREGIAYAYGKTYIGDAVNQAAVVSFTDSARTIQYGFTEYCTNAATGVWDTSISSDFSGLVIEDHTSYTTTFGDGVLVGTDNGRSGSSFIGTSTLDVSMDLYGGNNIGSLTTLYNTQMKNLTGGIVWGNAADHKYFGGSVAGCGQFDPVGAVQLRNLTISGYTGTLGALLWNENIDIQHISFIANTDITNNPAAVEHATSAGSPYSYTALSFSGNDFDGINTSGVDIIVALDSASNASTSTGANTITYTSSVALQMTVTDETGTFVNGAFAYIDDDNIVPFIMNTTTNASGVASVNHTGGAVIGSTWRVRMYGYKPYKATVDISSADISIPVTLIVDPQQT